ncbi:unnamed protein product [Mytilus coruscus]|uniref:Core-binding (CB) domain-containing protein n=1 Tax=Mytilus coruscus TaxID=42192 RepID=A0A6J8BFD7_MYTCO|nr:unnamed protein product [Mytilus coruscus]
MLEKTRSKLSFGGNAVNPSVQEAGKKLTCTAKLSELASPDKHDKQSKVRTDHGADGRETQSTGVHYEAIEFNQFIADQVQMQLKKLLPQAQGFNANDACSDTLKNKHMHASIDSNCEISESQSFSRPRAHYSKFMLSDDQISVVSHEIEDEISMGGSAFSDENNNDAHSQSQPSHDKEFSLFSEGAPGSTDPIKWNNFLHKLTAKLKINCSEETEVDSVRTSYLPSRLNPNNSDKATHLKLPLEGTTIEVFKNVEKEAMSGRLKNRSVRLRDDKAFMVSKKDFTDFCSPPRLDDNIEEDSEDDRVEACSALVACFKSMADMTSRIIANSVINRRKIFLKNVDFKKNSRDKQLFVCGKSPGRSSFVTLPQSVGSNNSRQVSTSDSEERFNFRFCKSSSFYRSKRDSCTQSRCKKVFYIRRGKFFIRKTCYRACPEKCRKSRLLQYNIHGTKTTRRSETNSKFKTTEPVCHTSSLQNGNPPIYSKKSENWGLGSKTVFTRCIFPYPHSQALQKVSPLQHFGKKVSIPSSPVRSTIGSKDFHKSDGSSRCISAKTNDSHIYVPGRLDVKKQLQSKADKTIAVHSGIVKKSGFDNQCKKILFSSDSNNRVSRSSDSLKRRSCFSVSTEIQKYKSDHSNIPKFTNRRGTCNVETTWSNGFMHRFSSIWARLHMRPLQLYLLAWWRPALHSLNHLIPLYQPLQEHLFWWLNRRNFFKGVLLEQESAQVTLVTDASQSGWGAHINNYQIAGVWPPQYKVKHINWLELKAVQLALHTFLIKVQFKSVLVRTDNATVVSYLNKQGGTRSPDLCYLAWDLLKWCINHNVKIQAVHISGKKNIIADALSRGRMTIRLTEWALDMTIVNLLFLQLGTPVIDLFATSMNKMLPVFCSPWPEETAVSIDALSMKWTGLFAYAFPPPIILNRVLQKIQKEDCLESCKRSYTAKGFSPKIASIISNARKQSTQTVYNARLKLFDSWCQERSINPSTSTVPEIAEFLMFLHTVKNCKPSTLAGYKSAIALIHSSKDRISINMDLRNLIKGMYNINPPLRQLAPNWDLPLVLLVLTKTPFEPLEEAELKYLTLKTVFLMALASAARVSELHSFTIK